MKIETTKGFVINGNPDGSANDIRLQAALNVCDRLGIDCERLPAQFIDENAQTRLKNCLSTQKVLPQSKHERGVWLAHLDAWRRVAETQKASFVFEDDVALPDQADSTTIKQIEDTIHKGGLNKIGSYFEAYFIDPPTAEKLLQKYDDCSALGAPVDIAVLDRTCCWDGQCKNDTISCNKASAAPSSGDHLCGHGIVCPGLLKQRAEFTSYRPLSALTSKKILAQKKG